MHLSISRHWRRSLWNQRGSRKSSTISTSSKSKDYYARIGKPWKWGYLLYGPPGTGKSTMIAPMANLLSYGVYDLELTAVKDNTKLRRLLIETTNKSIIVIEDIDCSLDLTCWKKNEEKSSDSEEVEKVKKEISRKENTLPGHLSFIDRVMVCLWRGEANRLHHKLCGEAGPSSHKGSNGQAY